jgi:hypothetical protein
VEGREPIGSVLHVGTAVVCLRVGCSLMVAPRLFVGDGAEYDQVVRFSDRHERMNAGHVTVERSVYAAKPLRW